MKAEIAAEYAELIYNGLWFTPHQQDLAAYFQSSQRSVSGTVRLRLHKGQVVVVGRKSPRSLYDMSMATYDEADKFDQSAAEGFIHVWGLPVRIQAPKPGAGARLMVRVTALLFDLGDTLWHFPDMPSMERIEKELGWPSGWIADVLGVGWRR